MGNSENKTRRRRARVDAPRMHMAGAAIILAMLVVTLTATLAASMMWQQWRVHQGEAAERSRMQAGWVLVGALDWARLILAEDGRTGGADHLAEPWAVQLEETKLTNFIAETRNLSSDELEGLPHAFFSGKITDAQAKLNVRNLVEGGRPVASTVEAFRKLFGLLEIPSSDIDLIVEGLSRASPNVSAIPAKQDATEKLDYVSAVVEPKEFGSAPLMPQTLDQLVWFGIMPSTLAKIDPYVTLLPTITSLNINTASSEALYATVPKLTIAAARRLTSQRQHQPFLSLSQAAEIIQESGAVFVDGKQGVATNYFEVRGRLRIEAYWIEERSLVRRDGMDVTLIWRRRGAGRKATEDWEVAR